MHFSSLLVLENGPMYLKANVFIHSIFYTELMPLHELTSLTLSTLLYFCVVFLAVKCSLIPIQCHSHMCVIKSSKRFNIVMQRMLSTFETQQIAGCILDMSLCQQHLSSWRIFTTHLIVIQEMYLKCYMFTCIIP